MAKLDGLDHVRIPAPDEGQSRMDAILSQPETSIRRALILALGEYKYEELSPSQRESWVTNLMEAYRNDPDAGIHGALEWTLRQWNQEGKLEAVNAELKILKDRGDCRWYVNSEGQTLAIVEGPVEFSKFSPFDPDRFFLGWQK
jgi:hypothetical protein